MGRRKIPPAIKKSLLEEAGFKCANPGCANTLVDFHHLKEWHVYKTHDEAEMIVVCPTCHGHVHRGTMRIEDRTIRSWKLIQRTPNRRAHLYVEPATPCRIVAGTICLESSSTSGDGVTVFQLSPGSSLGFRLVENEIMLMNSRVSDAQGCEVAQVVNGYVKSLGDAVVLECRPGRVRFTAPATDQFLPDAIFGRAGSPLLDLVENGRFELLDLEVRAPGIVKVSGVWLEGPFAVVVTKKTLYVSRPKFGGFVAFEGYDQYRGDLDDQSLVEQMPRIVFDGAISCSLFSRLFEDPGM